MTQEPAQSTPTVSIQTSAQPQRTPPPWLAEAVLILQLARDSALLTKMQQTVRVPRGRMGTFEVCDFFLVLLLYAVSGERTLLALYAAMAPCLALLAALWSRKHIPARCTLSRFLSAVAVPATEALRQLLFEDLLTHGLSGERVGGLVDRTGARHVLFDIDGTRQVARQRQVVSDEQHPPVRRRLSTLCTSGYPGRKRGEGVRTRSTVQQAHTREWLGTFGAAGNGDAFGDLERACKDIARYLKTRGLAPEQGIVRLDGLYGYVRGAYLVQQQGLGYLMRAADYSLLQDEPVKQVLAQPPQGRFVQPDTGTVREVFEVDAVPWATADNKMQVCCRLIITRREVDKNRAPGVGKRQGDLVLELFVCDRKAQGLSAQDMLSLYFARGGFEQTLAEEDQEQDPDRWCSAHPAGQESWQLLSQWVWNARLRLGVAAVSPPVRCTQWAQAHLPPGGDSPCAASAAPSAAVDPAPQSPGVAEASPQPPPTQVESVPPAPAPAPMGPVPPPVTPALTEPVPLAPALPPIAPGQVAAAAGRGFGKFAGPDFAWTAQQQLRCPAGKTLLPRERRVHRGRLCIRYQARTADCAVCSLTLACRGTHASLKLGRRVTVWAAVPTAQDADPRPALWAPACDATQPPLTASPSSESAPTEPSPSGPPPGPEIAAPTPLPLGPQPVWWEDVPATSLRRLSRLGMFCQRVEMLPAPPLLTEPPPLSRARRAHRRLSRVQRLARNAHPSRTQPWKINLSGVPAGITAYLASLGSPVP